MAKGVAEHQTQTKPKNSTVYQVGSEESISQAVIHAVESVSGRPPVAGNNALPPLYETINSDALNTVVERGEETESNVEVTFTYSGYTVSINSTDQIVVTDQ